jgi:hypothetical protein
MLRQTYRGVSHRDWCRYSAQDVSRMEPHLDQVPHKHRPSVTKNTVRNLCAALVVEQHRDFGAGAREPPPGLSTVVTHTIDMRIHSGSSTWTTHPCHTGPIRRVIRR